MAVLSLQNVSLRFGGAALLDEVDLHVERNDRLCVLGVNGAGKSSLLKLFSGEYTPDSGSVARERGIRISVLKQEAVGEDPDADALSVALHGLPHDDHEARAEILARRFLGELRVAWQGRAFATLSGGERRRVLLARALAAEPDVLILDEPTNHLDLESITALNEGMKKFKGCILFASHDHEIMQTVANRIIVLGKGKVFDKLCTYEEYLDNQ